MHPLQFLLLLPLLLTACSATPSISPSPPPTLDPTFPAESGTEISVTVFQDLNQNGARDPNEPGVGDAIGLAPDTDCTIGDPAVIIDAETDPTTGEYTYTDLSPGLYCVLYRGAQSITTEPAYTLNLASSERREVFFGVQP